MALTELTEPCLMVSRQQFVNILHFVHGKIGKSNCYPCFLFFNHTIHKFLKISQHIQICSDLLREIPVSKLIVKTNTFFHLQLSSIQLSFHQNTSYHITVEKSMQTSCMKQLSLHQKVRSLTSTTSSELPSSLAMYFQIFHKNSLQRTFADA